MAIDKPYQACYNKKVRSVGEVMCWNGFLKNFEDIGKNILNVFSILFGGKELKKTLDENGVFRRGK